MARFVIAGYTETHGVQQKIIEMDTQEAALRYFFLNFAPDYTKNEEGYAYFKEDFMDADKPLGSIIEL